MKSRILIIADDLDEANNFKRSLLSWDYNVVGVETSGEKALKKISELQPDLILMNTVLNGRMDGFEAYSKIKENLDIPIVYLIPQPLESILKQVNLKFAYCYLIKPVHEVVLKNTVDMAITNHSMEDIEKNYRNLFENTRDSIIIHDQNDIVLDVNPATCSMFGYDHDEFVGKSVKHLVSQECMPLLPEINEKLELQGYYDYEITLLHSDGSKIKAEAHCLKINYIHQDDVLCILNDVTEQKKVEKNLVESENRYRMLFENSQVSTAIISMDSQVIDANEQFFKNIGYVRGEIHDIHLKNMFKQFKQKKYIADTLLNGGKIREYEVELERKDGHLYINSINADLIRYQGQDVILVTAIDITERKRVEKFLKESEERYRGLFKYIGSGVAVYSAVQDGEDFIFTDFNNAAEEIDKLEKSDVIGKRVTEVFPNVKDFGLLNVMKRVYKTGKAENFPVTQYQDDRITGWRDNFVYRLPSGEVISVYDDVTERKKAEHKIKNSLYEKEILLKEIHHRVKNNLQIISSLLDLQEGYVKENNTAVNVLRESQNRVLSMAMVHEMLYQSEDLSNINCTDYINNLAFNLFDAYNVKNNITLLQDNDDIYLNIETSIPVGLIISELVSNSLKYAFPDDQTGELFISLKDDYEKFKLIISDDGVGLPEKFDFNDPDSTLGIKLVKSLVNQLDGTIELDRKGGTKYIIDFKEQIYKRRL